MVGYFVVIKTKNHVGKIWEKWQQRSTFLHLTEVKRRLTMNAESPGDRFDHRGFLFGYSLPA
jgi:hypothetical protein